MSNPNLKSFEFKSPPSINYRCCCCCCCFFFFFAKVSAKFMKKYESSKFSSPNCLVEVKLSKFLFKLDLCMCVFLLGVIICVATNKQSLYFQQNSVRVSLATKVILFSINRAAYSQQINNFNSDKHFTIANDF